MYQAMTDEMLKISASHGRMHVSKSRSGRRPISVTKLLAKEKDGSLFKDMNLESIPLGKPADPKRKSSDVPTREDGPVYPKTESVQTNRSMTALSPAINPNN